MTDEYIRNLIKKRVGEVYDILEEIEELVESLDSRYDSDDEDAS